MQLEHRTSALKTVQKLQFMRVKLEKVYGGDLREIAAVLLALQLLFHTTQVQLIFCINVNAGWDFMKI